MATSLPVCRASALFHSLFPPFLLSSPNLDTTVAHINYHQQPNPHRTTTHLTSKPPSWINFSKAAGPQNWLKRVIVLKLFFMPLSPLVTTACNFSRFYLQKWHSNVTPKQHLINFDWFMGEKMDKWIDENNINWTLNTYRDLYMCICLEKNKEQIQIMMNISPWDTSER